MATWAPGMEFVPLTMQEPQQQTWAAESEVKFQTLAMQQQQCQFMWYPSVVPMVTGPFGSMLDGPLGSKDSGPPGVMKSPPGTLASPAIATSKPPGSLQVPTAAVLTVAAASAENNKGSDLALLIPTKEGKCSQTREELERQMMASYMTAKTDLAAPAACAIKKRKKGLAVPASTKADVQAEDELGKVMAFDTAAKADVLDSPCQHALTERQLRIASMSEQFNKSFARKGFPQKASALRHSTFSALNLEVGGRPKGSTIGKRQTLAELKESVNNIRRASGKQSTAAAASAVGIEDGFKAGEAKAKSDNSSASSGTRTPPSDEERASVRSPSATCDVFGFDGLQLSRSLLLRFRKPSADVPQELQTLTVTSDPAVVCNASKPVDRLLFGTGLSHSIAKAGPGQYQNSAPSPKISTSENGWKPAGSTTLSRPDRLRRDWKSLLNKVCPENVMTIVERIAITEIATIEELELLITLIFDKALAEPHYCEAYADMIFVLKDWMPRFPSATTGKLVTFRAALINKCQHEFESLSSILSLDAKEMANLETEEADFQKKRKKDRVLANMKFIGQLFLREMLSSKIIGSVIQDLAKCNEAEEDPEEPMVECICELLANIGYTLEASPVGASALTSVCSRLTDLKSKRTENSKSFYSKRIQFAIQDLLDIRAAGWTKRTFKASAKTKAEIRCQQERDIAAQAQGWQVQEAEVQVAGAKPLWLSSGC